MLVVSIKSRFVYLLNDDFFKAITYLDPNYKNFEFIKDPIERSNILKEVKKIS